MENGKDTAGRTLIAFGGAAPLHAVRLAQKLGIGRVLVPGDAGVGSALGFLHAPIAYEVVRTKLVRLDALDGAALDALFAEMRAEAEAVVRLGAPDAVLDEVRTGFMRYRGQGHEVSVRLPAVLDAAALRATFDETYARLYGRVIPGLEVEALTWVLSLAEAHALPEAGALPPDCAPGDALGRQRIIDPATGLAADAAIYLRAGLPRGARLHGPAVIAEDGTSTVVPPGFMAKLTASGEILIERAA